MANRFLERYGHDEHIDHRSHAERGLDEQPTIHESVVARVLEWKGIISDRCELNRQIKADNALLRKLKATVKKEIEELRSEKAMLLQSLDCTDDAAMGDVKKDIAAMEGAVKKLDEQEVKYSVEFESALQQYRELETQIAELDAEELADARLDLRPRTDRSTVSRIQTAYDTQYSPFTMAEARSDISKMLDKYEEELRPIRERLRNHQQEKAVSHRKDQNRER